MGGCSHQSEQQPGCALGCTFLHLKAGPDEGHSTTVFGVFFNDEHEFCHMRSDSLRALEAAALPTDHSQRRNDQRSAQLSALSLPSSTFLHLDYL